MDLLDSLLNLLLSKLLVGRFNKHDLFSLSAEVLSEYRYSFGIHLPHVFGQSVVLLFNVVVLLEEVF